MDAKQIAARTNFRNYLGETYGRDVASLIYNIADLESNFRADATNRTSSASGITQITSGHWATLAESVRGKLRRGEMTEAQLPAGMTATNITDFDQHKFDEISGAFMTRENIDYLGRQYVSRANKQRSALGQPPVANMSELTGGNFALESFMIAGGHKDGWGVHTSGKLEGTGFGVAIQGGQINMDALIDSYEQNRARNDAAGEPITDGMGHGLTYAMYASDNVMENAGGPKLQLSPNQIKRGLALKSPTVRVDNKLTAPWLDRAQQIDPGFEPNDEQLSEWLPRLDLADPNQLAGANDIVSTGVLPELQNEALPRATPITPTAVPELRAESEDPTLAARASTRLGRRQARSAAQAIGPNEEFLQQAPVQTAAQQVSANAGDNTGVGLRPRSDASAPRPSVQRTGRGSGNNNRQGPSGLSFNEPQGRNAPSGTTDRAAPSVEPATDPTLGADLPGFGDFGSALLPPNQQPFDVAPPLQPPAPGVADGDLLNAYQLNQDTRNFSAEEGRLSDIVNLYNESRRARSGELEQEIMADAALQRQQDEQDIALALTPNINLQSAPQQGFQQPSLADYAVPGNPAFNIGNVTPSAGQLQRVVNQGRVTDQDYEIAAARDALARENFGSINEYVNAQRGTDFEAQNANREIQAASLGLAAMQSGELNYQNLPELQALMSKRDGIAPLFSQQIINASRGR